MLVEVSKYQTNMQQPTRLIPLKTFTNSPYHKSIKQQSISFCIKNSQGFLYKHRLYNTTKMRRTSSLSIAALIFIWNSCVKADLENEVKKLQGLRGSQGDRKIGLRRNVRQRWERLFEDQMKNQVISRQQGERE
jgi:hypothetical protein